jgi:hypothetical protein
MAARAATVALRRLPETICRLELVERPLAVGRGHRGHRGHLDRRDRRDRPRRLGQPHRARYRLIW